MPRVVIPVAGAERKYRSAPASPVQRCANMDLMSFGIVKESMLAAGYAFPPDLCVNDENPVRAGVQAESGFFATANMTMSFEEGVRHWGQAFPRYSIESKSDIVVAMSTGVPMYDATPEVAFVHDYLVTEIAGCTSRFFGAQISLAGEDWIHAESLVFDFKRRSAEYFSTWSPISQHYDKVFPILERVVSSIGLRIGQRLHLVPVSLMYGGIFRWWGTQQLVDAFDGMCWVHATYYAFLRALNPDAPASRLMMAMVAGPTALRTMYRFGALVADCICRPTGHPALRKKRHGTLRYAEIRVPWLWRWRPPPNTARSTWAAYKEFFTVD